MSKYFHIVVLLIILSYSNCQVTIMSPASLIGTLGHIDSGSKINLIKYK
ncbi:MAG: hypothetical protein MJ252_16560 [archaeon]|nr:hypothetical protein [archaeon]